MVKVDLRLYSSSSADCRIEPAGIAARCHQLGLSPVFLTDHGTIEGAVRHHAIGGYRVVVGEEVLTAGGEIIGLFLERQVESSLRPRETALEIKSQGGLVYLEHPYDPLRRHLGEASFERLVILWKSSTSTTVVRTSQAINDRRISAKFVAWR